MNCGINRRSKYLYAVIILFLIGQSVYPQTDIVTLTRVKDFINAGLTHIILSNYSIQKDSAGKNWKEIDTVLQKNALSNPVYYSALHKLLEGKFDSVTKKFSSKFDLVDVASYVNLDEKRAMQTLYDTAFSLLRAQYGNLFHASSKDSIYLLLINKATPKEEPLPSIKKDTVQSPMVKKTSEPSYIPWYARFQGFLFWLLVCVLISVGLFLYCLDQIRQLKIKLTDVEKAVTQIQEERDPLSSHSGPVTTVYTEFRSLVTSKIKELYDIIDHLNFRIITLEKERQETPSLIEEAAMVTDSVDDGEIFYMGVPSEGYFPFAARSLKKDALYKFILNGSHTKAQYEVINDGIPIGEVLKDLPKFFEPACIAENQPQGEIRVIITKAPGTAIFDGEKWAIQQKAIILFI